MKRCDGERHGLRVPPHRPAHGVRVDSRTGMRSLLRACGRVGRCLDHLLAPMVIGVIEDVVSSQCFRADRDRKRIAAVTAGGSRSSAKWRRATRWC